MSEDQKSGWHHFLNFVLLFMMVMGPILIVALLAYGYELGYL